MFGWLFQNEILAQETSERDSYLYKTPNEGFVRFFVERS